MRHVYVHVPFCRRRCSYCDFAIAVRRQVPSREFVGAVARELEVRDLSGSWADGGVETLYVGGGTPSLLEADAFGRLVELFPLASSAEVTIEANPDDVSTDAAHAWRGAGVTRVSLGVQSFHSNVLEWMHRTHGVARIAQAVDALRGAGFANVSFDLMFGMPASLAHDVGSDLRDALALAPDHLSVYGLTTEPRTPLARWIARGTVTPIPDDGYVRDFLGIHDTLTAAGFEHYEISNYARGSRSRHNAAYWSGASYVGLGPSAHGFTGTARRWNAREWVEYARRIGAGEDPREGVERLSVDQRDLERLYLGLRCVEGIEEQAHPLDRAALEDGFRCGWLARKGGRIVATPRGWLMLDGIVPGLTTRREGG